MGRVRRYKKYKACDPYAKKQKSEIDLVHDQPPEIHEQKVKKNLAKMEKIENNELAQYRKSLKMMEKLDNKDNYKIDGKKKEESMKTFLTRVRQETRVTLRDELKGMTSTAQKRKERLKERKVKRKNKHNPNDNYEQVLEFNQSETKQIRASDRNDAPMNFRESEQIGFHERVEKPPDFRHVYKLAGAKKAGLLKTSNDNNNNHANGHGGGGKDDNSGGLTAGQRFMQSLQKRKNSTNDTDDSNGPPMKKERGFKDGIIHRGTNGTVSEADVIATRNRVTEAYKLLKEKRRLGGDAGNRVNFA